MIIMCSVSENIDNIVKIVLLKKNKILYSQECNRNDFCEKLPLMIKSIIIFLGEEYNQYINNMGYMIDFDIDRHLTTYRIFESFIYGFADNAEIKVK